MSKFKVGQRVRTTHRMGGWEGTVVMVNNTGEGIEYEVSDSPHGMVGIEFPINFPLLWEEQLTAVNEET